MEGTRTYADESDDDEIRVSLAVTYDQIKPLHFFRVNVRFEHWQWYSHLRVAVAHNNELLYPAAQWIGAAMGCTDSKSASDKMRDLIRKLPRLSHDGSNLSDLTSSNVITICCIFMFTVLLMFLFCSRCRVCPTNSMVGGFASPWKGSFWQLTRATEQC